MVREMCLLQEAFHLHIQLGAADSEEAQASSEGLDHTLAHHTAEGTVHMQVHPVQELGPLEHRDYIAPVHLLNDERH